MDTFVVRVLGPLADGREGETSLRGVVEHIASGRSDRFRTAEELVSILRGSPGMSSPAPEASDSVG